MLKKEEIYVHVSNKEQAEKYRKVLEAMGEEFDIYFPYREKSKGILFADLKDWIFADHPNLLRKRTEITFGQLIDLLSTPVKIAVRVENEREYDALMKYYDSLGFSNSFCFSRYPEKRVKEYGFLLITFEKEFIYPHENYGKIESLNPNNYQIIPFADFAKDKGINVPLYLSIDGVDVFENDLVWIPQTKTEGGYYKEPLQFNARNTWGPNQNLFAKKQAALDWIEDQKPKETVLDLGGLTATVKKTETVIFNIATNSLSHEDIKSIYKAMNELSNG